MHDALYLWFLADPASPRLVGELRLMAVGKGVSLTYAPSWLVQGFALSEDLPLINIEHLPRAKAVAAGEHFKGCGVTDADLASLAQRIDGGELLAMRQSFKAVD